MENKKRLILAKFNNIFLSSKAKVIQVCFYLLYDSSNFEKKILCILVKFEMPQHFEFLSQRKMLLGLDVVNKRVHIRHQFQTHLI